MSFCMAHPRCTSHCEGCGNCMGKPDVLLPGSGNAVILKCLHYIRQAVAIKVHVKYPSYYRCFGFIRLPYITADSSVAVRRGPFGNTHCKAGTYSFLHVLRNTVLSSVQKPHGLRNISDAMLPVSIFCSSSTLRLHSFQHSGEGVDSVRAKREWTLR